jgi:hypothetical protein
MANYGPNGGVVVGQPISPFFGAQNGANAAAPIIQQPTSAPVPGGMQATGVQMSVLEACSRGIIPRNAQLASVAGQAVSVGVSALQGDSMTLDEALGSGNGAQVNLGVAVPPNANNNVATETAGVNNQVFVEGIASGVATSATGPAATNIESVVSAPTPASTSTANVSLLAGAFQG